MGRFLNTLIIEDALIKRKDRKRFEVYMRPFEYVANNGFKISVPIGFKTDFASVPRLFRGVISTTGQFNGAAVVHDFCCESKIVSRKRADRIFLEAMKALDVSWLKRRAMYSGVRAYSIATFKK